MIYRYDVSTDRLTVVRDDGHSVTAACITLAREAAVELARVHRPEWVELEHSNPAHAGLARASQAAWELKLGRQVPVRGGDR